ncbi:MAG: HEPN domain-containing protein [Treponema sp.]|jgi:HEPN domain-containing protein|nr:HEPN domain-containing protein [Treponema sp.]
MARRHHGLYGAEGKRGRTVGGIEEDIGALVFHDMELREKLDYWLDIALYDLETAEAMFTSGRWLYVVFMCQQAIEKLCKGLYLLFIDDDIPKIHDINSLLTKFEDKLPVAIDDEKRLLFAKLSAFYLNNRYPKYKERLSVSLNKEEAQNILEQTREAFTWLQTLKP